MTYQSVDALQNTLADTVFAYTTDRKKAAGRALGTLVELVTFYVLRSWDLRDHILIERQVPEYANPSILHNVEFSLHRVIDRCQVNDSSLVRPITTAKLKSKVPFPDPTLKNARLLSTDGVKRNACVIGSNPSGIIVANLDSFEPSNQEVTFCLLETDPFTIVECKRVGVEEGMRKGPQTIEKAKQGAYVARSVSSLQKVRMRSGDFQGILENIDGTIRMEPYRGLLKDIIGSPEEPPSGFILTIGVVSNHGNWFTSEDHNKELRVLAQSYDWLLFLTDEGLSHFIDNLLLHPITELAGC